jgi:hypothetical protein
MHNMSTLPLHIRAFRRTKCALQLNADLAEMLPLLQISICVLHILELEDLWYQHNRAKSHLSTLTLSIMG